MYMAHANPGLMKVVSRQGCPPGHKLKLRVAQTTEAYSYIIRNSSLHKLVFTPGVDVEEVEAAVQQKCEDFQARLELVAGQGGTVEILPNFLPLVPTAGEELDWFSRFGPRQGKIYSLLVPDLHPSLPPEWASIVEKGADEVYRGFSLLMDPNFVAPPSALRSPDLSFGDWLISRLSNCTREGLANDGEMLLALYSVSIFAIALFPCYCTSSQVKLGQQMKRAIEHGRKGLRGSKSKWFHDVPGTSAWWAWQREEMEAHRQWRGPPLFFITTSCSTMSNDLMSTFIVHNAKRGGQMLDVWTAEDESKLLSVLPGKRPAPHTVATMFTNKPRLGCLMTAHTISTAHALLLVCTCHVNLMFTFSSVMHRASVTHGPSMMW